MISVLKKIVFSYFVLLSIFLFSLILVCLIPSSLLKNNIGTSLTTLKSEGTYPTAGFPLRPIVLDNFTDPVMLNTAYSVDSKQPFRSALTNIRHAATLDEINQIINLESLYKNQAKVSFGYERYWHGYLVFLRPMLVFFPYSFIRIIISVSLYAALLFFLFQSWKKLGKKATIYFLIGLVAVDFFSIGKSMQFSGVFFIGIIGSIYLLSIYKKNHDQYLLFFIIGGLTSFIDLLTAPLVTLGMMLVVLTLLNKNSKILLYSVFWSMGYLSLWASKWIIAQFFFAPGAISTSFNQIINRTVTKADANFSIVSALRLNIFQLIGYDRTEQIILLSLFGIIFLISIRYFSFSIKKLKTITPWVIIALVPYVWYVIAANHSYLHVWYTYRNQFMSVVAACLIYSEFIDWERVNESFKKFTSKSSKS